MNSGLIYVFLVTLAGAATGSVLSLIVNFFAMRADRIRLDTSLGIGAAIGAAIGSLLGVFWSLMGRLS